MKLSDKPMQYDPRDYTLPIEQAISGSLVIVKNSNEVCLFKEFTEDGMARTSKGLFVLDALLLIDPDF